MSADQPLSESLVELRQVFAVAQKDLGEQGTISRIERGLHRAQPATIREIASRMGCDLTRVALACRESYRRGASNRSEADATPLDLQTIPPKKPPGTEPTPFMGFPNQTAD